MLPHSCGCPFVALKVTEIAQVNMRLALERRAESAQVMPLIRLVVGLGWTAPIPVLGAEFE